MAICLDLADELRGSDVGSVWVEAFTQAALYLLPPPPCCLKGHHRVGCSMDHVDQKMIHLVHGSMWSLMKAELQRQEELGPLPCHPHPGRAPLETERAPSYLLPTVGPISQHAFLPPSQPTIPAVPLYINERRRYYRKPNYLCQNS